MKNILFIAFLFSSLSAMAQIQVNPFPKTITVTGSAEMEIIPDEIYIQVDLREYEKKGQPKVNLEVIKSSFLAQMRAAGIPDSLISIASYDGYVNPWQRRKQKKEELYASISYQLKIKNAQQIDDIVNRLDDNATQNFYISQTTHSRLTEFRKQLKIAAVKAAKEKAGYLAAAVNEQVGDAVTITEPTEYHYPMARQAMVSNTMITDKLVGPEKGAMPDFRKLKFKYDVTVVFALQ